MMLNRLRFAFLASHLAYGTFGACPIPGHAVIVFNVETIAAR